jgi:hypothetical protein
MDMNGYNLSSLGFNTTIFSVLKSIMALIESLQSSKPNENNGTSFTTDPYIRYSRYRENKQRERGGENILTHMYVCTPILCATYLY